MTNIAPLTDQTLVQLIDSSGIKRTKIADDLDIHRSRLWQLLDKPEAIDAGRIEKLAVILNVDHRVVYQSIHNQIGKKSQEGDLND